MTGYLHASYLEDGRNKVKLTLCLGKKQVSLISASVGGYLVILVVWAMPIFLCLLRHDYDPVFVLFYRSHRVALFDISVVWNFCVHRTPWPGCECQAVSWLSGLPWRSPKRTSTNSPQHICSLICTCAHLFFLDTKEEQPRFLSGASTSTCVLNPTPLPMQGLHSSSSPYPISPAFVIFPLCWVILMNVQTCCYHSHLKKQTKFKNKAKQQAPFWL